MKISLIISIFLFYSCNEMQRKSGGNWQRNNTPEENTRENIPQLEDLQDSKKEIARLERILRFDFKLRYKGFFQNGNKWAYKVQVPQNINRENLIRVLEDFRERGERLSEKIQNELKYKKELDLKIEAVKYFLENYDRDRSLFVTPQKPVIKPPVTNAPIKDKPREETGYCSTLEGMYWEMGKEYRGKSIEIIKINCTDFKLKLNNQNNLFNVSFSKNFKCNSIGNYALCTKGIKIDNKLINLLINEKQLDTGCSLNKNITIDLSRGILKSAVTYFCQDRAKNYSKIISYQLTAD